MGMKKILLTLTIFLMFLMPAYGAVNVQDVQITPDAQDTPKTGDDLTCSFNVTATGGEVLDTVNVTWTDGDVISENITSSYQNNTLQTNTLSNSNTKKNDNWECEVYAEGNLSNTSTGTDNVNIENTAPSVSVSNKNLNTGDTLSFNVGANDPDVSDGVDTLNYSLSNSPNGMSINSNGKITWSPQDNQTGTYNNVNVQVEDESGATDSSTFSVEVTQMMLAIEDMDASCSEDCNEDVDENGGSIDEVQPDSQIELDITVENLWDEDVEEDHDIEDVEVIGTLDDMGDEDEQEEEEDENSIGPEEEEDFTLKFDIPREADEDDYDLDIEVTGEDEDGTDYEITLDIDVEVEKEDDDLMFDRARLSPSTVSCNRDVRLDLRVKNIGADDQEEAQLTVRNSALDISEQEFYTVESGDYDDDDTEYDRNYNFNIADSVSTGTYQIEVRAYYEDDDKYEREMLPVTVRECQTTQPDQQDDEETGEDQGTDEEQQEVEVIENQQPPTQTPGQQPAEPVTETPEESFYDSTAFLIILAGAFVILLVGVILLAIIAFRK